MKISVAASPTLKTSYCAMGTCNYRSLLPDSAIGPFEDLDVLCGPERGGVPG